MARALALALALFAALTLPVQGQPRFDFDTAPGRLSKQVVPSRYVLKLDVDPARDGFAGEATIRLRVRKPVASFAVHATQLKAGSATLLSAQGPRELRIEPDDKAMLWRLVPTDGEPIPPGEHALRIAYTGVVHGTGEGLYHVDYKIGSKPSRMLATQLEEIRARSLFPGFDEPAFRAVFELSVRAPSDYEVVANMPQVEQRVDGNATLHRFAPTPPMPSYLLALAVGRFDVLSGEAAGVPLRIFTAPGKRDHARYAL